MAFNKFISTGMLDEPEEEPASTSSPATNQFVDPIEGTSLDNTNSPIDESSNDSTSSGPLNRCDVFAKCEKCSALGELTLYKTIEKPGQKPITILRSYCVNCKCFFGLCSKKYRQTYYYVDEDGGQLTPTEKSDAVQLEKRKTLSRSNSGEPLTADEPHSSSFVTPATVDFEKKNEDEGVDERMEVSVNGNQEDHDGASQNVPSARKKSKKNVFGGKSKKTNWTTSRKKNQRRSATGKFVSDNHEAKIVDETAPDETTKRARKEQESQRATIPRTKTSSALSPAEGKRKNRNVKVQQSSSTEASFSEGSTKSPERKVSSKAVEAFCQTDAELLIRSTYLRDTFNQTIRQGLGEQVAARLNEQPTILKKQFLLMLKTIQDQAAKIEKFEASKEKYQTACIKLKEFGRSTRLEFSDSFREIRADLVERKEEFRAHESEVAAIISREKTKFEKHRANLEQQVEDLKLEVDVAHAKIKYFQQELEYETKRADHFLFCKEAAERLKSFALDDAETIRKHMNDSLWVAGNERCSNCKATEKLHKAMTEQVAASKETAEKAVQDRDEAKGKEEFFKSVANKLGKDCDTVKYERDVWKSTAEKHKKEADMLKQQLKEKDRELAERIKESAETPSYTPRSVVSTPAGLERITPPEEGELPSTPPQGSPGVNAVITNTEKSLQKVVIQKTVEKKAPLPIASGFESWVPKDKLNDPAPEVPKSVSAFGVSIKQKNEQPKAKYGPCSQPNPWEKNAEIVSSSSSDSLSEAMARVHADSFVGGGCTSSYTSKSFTGAINEMMNERNRIREKERMTEKAVREQKRGLEEKFAPTGPPLKKPKHDTLAHNPSIPIKNAAPAIIHTQSSKPPASCTGVGSLSNMKKIPKFSEKPPQPEFAPALGLSEKTTDSSSIPGLGMNKLDEKTNQAQKPDAAKINPAVIKLPVTPSQSTLNKTSTPQQRSLARSSNLPKKQHVEPDRTKNQSSTKACNNKQDPTNKFNSNSKSNKNKNHVTPKKKNRNGNRSEFTQHSPWERPPNETPEKQWRQQPQQYGIQTKQSFPIDFGLDGSWGDNNPRNGMRQNESPNLLPWHRAAQDTPFGKVPIQENFAMNRSMPMPMPPQRPQPSPQQHPQHQPFYSQRESSFFPPARDFPHQPAPQQSRMNYSPAFGYPGPPNQGGGNPRSFYS